MYSQNDEEKVILELFANQPKGHLLDIGAFDGKTFSNSLALIERGWSGVLVEPNPTSLNALINLHGKNPDVQIVGGLVSPESGLKKFFTCNDAVSTTDEGFTELWKRAGVQFQPIWLPPVHPAEICYGHKFDFITVDVEDGTLPIVNAMIGAFTQAKVACVEHSVGHHTIKRELMEIFTSLGYRLVHETGENYIFSKE
jgi:hypothetical protein